MDLRTLTDLLHKEQKIHEKILLAKREEQRCLATGDANRLLQNASRLNDLVEEARLAERRRRTLVGQLGMELGLDSPNPTLNEILEILPPANRAELETLGRSLKQTVHEVKDMNAANQVILQRAVETLHTEIRQIIQSEDSGVYTPTGAKDSRPVPRAGLNLRA